MHSSHTPTARLPQHIAIIMDGNGRWAQRRSLPRLAGHHAGVTTATRLVKACVHRQIQMLSFFAFSTENWKRPASEITGLFQLFETAFHKELETLMAYNVQLCVIGNRQRFKPSLREKIVQAEQCTQDNTGLKLIVAANYGGQWDIVQAAQKIAQQVVLKKLQPHEITTEHFQKHLQLADLPAPDLCIRTGGEFRMSNFLLWHLAYTEFYFIQTLWPDFDESALEEALYFYAHRDRRFGSIHEKTTP